ncbi:MAG: YaiI/YqxD family protein [Alphaproteobacteria bacterium]
MAEAGGPALYVDADACPVKDEAMRVARRHGLAIVMVGNTWMRLGNAPDVRRVVVPEGPDAADDWIAENAAAGDVVVTADIPLAARCLKAGAEVLGPAGRPFTEDSIGAALAMREINQMRRDMGEIGGGGPSFSSKDRSRFLDALERAVQAAKRRQPV